MTHQQWIVCGAAFIEGDVIRLHEGVFLPDRYNRSQRVKVGERSVTAQVLLDPLDSNEMLELEVVASDGRNAYQVGDTVRRARRSVSRDDTERLAWSDEEARASVVDSMPEAQAKAMQQAQIQTHKPLAQPGYSQRVSRAGATGAPWRRKRKATGAYAAKP